MKPHLGTPYIGTTHIGIGRDLAVRMDVRSRLYLIDKLLGRLRYGLGGRANDT